MLLFITSLFLFKYPRFVKTAYQRRKYIAFAKRQHYTDYMSAYTIVIKKITPKIKKLQE